MTPTIPIPTDNIFKFACFFGLAMIVSAIFAFTSVYTSSLDQKIKYAEVIISLTNKTKPTKGDIELLTINKSLLEITKQNESMYQNIIGLFFGAGAALSIFGANKWYRIIQLRDDRIAQLQIEKLEHEINKLSAEISNLENIPQPSRSDDSRT